MLFTFIVESEGATTVEQISETNVWAAVLRWNEVSLLRPNILSERLLLDPPTAITGTTNVWSVSGIGRDEVFFLGHVVATLETEAPVPTEAPE